MQIYQGDRVRLRPDFPNDGHWSPEMQSYVNREIYVRTATQEYVTDPSGHSFERNTDVVEITYRTPRPEYLITGDRVRLHFAAGACASYLAAELANNPDREFTINSYIPGTGRFLMNEFPSLLMESSRVREVLPREDGFVPRADIRFKVGDFVLLRGRDMIIPGQSHPEHWAPRMMSNIGGVVEIGAINSANTFRIQSDNADDRDYEYRFVDILKVATEEDKLAWEIEKARRKEEREKLLASACVTKDKVLTLAQSVFGEEFVEGRDIIGGFAITVHFPEIKITNSLNQEHTIRDIFVKFLIKEIGILDGCLFSLGILGARTTWTAKEVNSQYTHSHLGIGIHMAGPSSWKNFCLGSSDFQIIVQNTKMHGQEEDWMMLFLSLENYVSWESIEGGPYIPIRQITSASDGTVSTLDSSTVNNEAKKLCEDLPASLLEYDGEKFWINPDNPEVIDYFDRNSALRTRRINSQSERIRNVLSNLGSRTFRFNDKDFPFKMIEENATPENPNSGPIDPSLIVSYCTFINSSINSFIKNYTYDLHKSRSQDIFAKAAVYE